MTKLTNEEQFIEQTIRIMDQIDSYNLEVIRGKLKKIRENFPELIRVVRSKAEDDLW